MYSGVKKGTTLVPHFSVVVRPLKKVTAPAPAILAKFFGYRGLFLVPVNNPHVCRHDDP